MLTIGAHMLTCLLLAAWTCAAAVRDHCADELARLNISLA